MSSREEKLLFKKTLGLTLNKLKFWKLKKLFFFFFLHTCSSHTLKCTDDG